MAELRLQKLGKQFGGSTHVVRAVGLRLASGEFMVLLGPSGCGKSTLLRRVAGLEDPSEGRNQVEAMTLGQRIAVFNAGRIEQVGAPMDLYERPDNRFVAGFLGSPQMNFLPAEAATGPGPTDGARPLGVRPEHLRLEPGDQGPPVRVERIENLGDVALIHGRARGVAAPLIVKSALAARGLTEPGQALRLQADADRLLRFDDIGLRMP